ncbi:TIGR03617 family F420-dependent LLM class oxidoreductase [Gordonia liuliyuniae]|uniref:TIGR03617 family F420-dependent LLM class oxidoreductase n=1 Tax=Gordonia liuliyuniae TaxID=2911517 RepID=A0ABS9IP08_9ACTN|nr:TIGR03617 family F420-dependent LLM class oxidoreductase [Gordonia liuliyuniae]MCF8587298.1 TIGR03617 family F420-dependent LLM class oxidoreductase [Gordonia liuliyuniae]
MKVGIPLGSLDGALSDVPERAAAAETAGFDSVSFSEVKSDPMLHLTVAAGATHRVDLLTNIVVAFARSPMMLAVQARTLQEYSGGRLVLGLGSQIKPHIERRFSMPWSAPAPRMAEFVSAMRAIWHAWSTGDPLDFRGEFYTHTLMTPMFSPAGDVPDPAVLLAAVGEQMTETAGRVADGILLHPFSTERYIRDVTRPALERGRAKSAGLGPVEIVGSTFVVTGETEKEVAASAAAVRGQVAFYGSTPAYRGVLELHGLGDLGAELTRLSKMDADGRWQQMADLIDDETLDLFAVTGTPREAAASLRQRAGGCVTRYEINNIGIRSPRMQAEVAAALQELQ